MSVEIDRGSLAAVFAAAKEKMRYCLNAIRITSTETVGTNGRILVRVSHPEPVAEGWSDGEGIGGEILMRQDTADSALKALPKLKTKRGRPESRAVVSDGGSIGYGLNLPAGTDGSTRVQESPLFMEGSFPDPDSVTPARRAGPVCFRVNVEYLETMIKVAKEVHAAEGYEKGKAGTDPWVRLEFQIPPESDWQGISASSCKQVAGPIRIDDGTGRMIGVLMPIMVD